MKGIVFFTLIGLVIFLPFCRKGQTGNNLTSEPADSFLVPFDSAYVVAKAFNPTIFFNSNTRSNHQPVKSKLKGNNDIKNYFTLKDSGNTPAIYVFNFTNGDGFLFVSADFRMSPILAFFEQGEFSMNSEVPSGLLNWLNKTGENIHLIRTNKYNNTKQAYFSWKNFSSLLQDNSLKLNKSTNSIQPPPDPCSSNPNYYNVTTQTIGPLLDVTWGQACSYNELCPLLSCTSACGNGHTWTGCVATSVAQLIKFWHPATFSAYSYATMPSSTGDTAVQRLMHNIGLGVGMNYDCSGSGANSDDIPGVLSDSFNIQSSANTSYSLSNWTYIQNNLVNYNWPVLLGGCNVDNQVNFIITWRNDYEDCHEWLCDGYQQSDFEFCSNGSLSTYSEVYFHMNWGWHEANGNTDYNGWFAINNWTIPNQKNFQYYQHIIYNIHP